MERVLIAKILLPFVLLGCSVQCAAQPEASISEDENEIRAGVEAYCRYRMGNNLDGIVSLIDENYVGWPSFSSKPVDKQALREALEQAMKRSLEGARFECSVNTLVVKVFGDVAIAYSLESYRVANPSGDTAKQTIRIAQTWRRRSGRWKIVGGMSTPGDTTQN